MELKLDRDDLKPEFRNIANSSTAYAHFKYNVRIAIQIVGQAVFWGSHDTYNAIYPPNIVDSHSDSKLTSS